MDINIKYYAAFASDEFFTASFIKKLYDFFGNIEAAWLASSYELHHISGLSDKKIQSFIEKRKKINPDIELEKIYEAGVSIITYDDKNYPDLLRKIPDCPMALYYIGNKELFNSKYNMAVVGSRKCSITGKGVLTKIISDFKNSDLCITSGLALGIDTTAHTAALNNNLGTIAVLGSGLKNIYPSQNKKLFNDIIEKGGLVISEYPLYAKPDAFHFPQRNRIVSGLCSCTLVAEAHIKSGALITARLCLEQNRELMCIPGMIANPATEGIYKLLKEGAGIVTSSEDILNIMNWSINPIVNTKNKQNTYDLSEQENLILNILKRDSLNIDEIAYKSGLHIDDLMIILTHLEIKDFISQTESGIYTVI